MHVYTFACRGKTSALELLTNVEDIKDTFQELGQQWDLSAELMGKLEAFTCLLYGPKTSSTKVNDHMYHLFCVKKGEIESFQLPLCRDCIVKHVRRANYRAGIFRRRLEQNPQVSNPVGRGWKADIAERVEQLTIDWMDEKLAPRAVLDLLACRCPRKCMLPKCECLSNGLKCTNMCRLRDCENQASTSDDEGSTDEDGGSDDDKLENY